jgi:hypothetical protein
VDGDRTVVDQALDYLVYAPLGLALEARDLIPKLAERGRGQVAMARIAGRFAAQRGQKEARRIVDGLVGDSAEREAGPRAPERGSPPQPFGDYDELTAQEIILRLSGLDEEQLDRVVDYEEHHRGRSTIINRVRQLRY